LLLALVPTAGQCASSEIRSRISCNCQTIVVSDPKEKQGDVPVGRHINTETKNGCDNDKNGGARNDVVPLLGNFSYFPIAIFEQSRAIQNRNNISKSKHTA